MSSSVIPRRRRSAAIRMASSSEVVVRDVAKQKWSTSSSPRNIPKWVWVLPTSIVRSIGSQDYRQLGDPLDPYGLERGLQAPAIGWIQLQERLEHEATRLDLGVGNLVVGLVDALALDDQDVDVERARRVPRG